MLNSFLFAEAPDGGFGFKISKDSKLSILFVGTAEDMFIAEGAMEICRMVTQRSLFLAKVLNKALISTGYNDAGEMEERFVQVRVNKDILLEIAKDAENPLGELEEDLDTLFHFIRFIHAHKDVMESQPYGEEMKDFLIHFFQTVSCLFDENPLECEHQVADMEWLQTHPDWRVANENMKVMYAIQMENDED